jgi:thiamine monophosphate kinase
VGGNLREATKFSAVGTAIGLCASYRPLSRSGARDGNLLVSIGAGGIFWRDAIALLNGGDVASKDKSPIYRPRSQIRVLAELARLGLVRAAMDNSDGLLPSLAELAEKSRLGVMLELGRLSVHEVPSDAPIDPARLWLGWGDWNVIAAVDPDDYEEIEQITIRFGTDINKLGFFTREFSGVRVERGGVMQNAPRLESERFAKDSWMLTGGVEKYVDLLLSVALPL